MLRPNRKHDNEATQDALNKKNRHDSMNIYSTDPEINKK